MFMGFGATIWRIWVVVLHGVICVPFIERIQNCGARLGTKFYHRAGYEYRRVICCGMEHRGVGVALYEVRCLRVGTFDKIFVIWKTITVQSGGTIIVEGTNTSVHLRVCSFNYSGFPRGTRRAWGTFGHFTT